MSLDALFSPKSVLLVGSSKISEKFIMVKPEIFDRVGINLNRFSVSGKIAIASVEERLDLKACDLAVITLPPEKTLEIMPSLKAKAAIILSGGFDADQRKKLKAIAASKRMRVLGPNSVCGVINPYVSLNTTFEPEMKIRPGRIAVISQSGGVGVTLLDYMVSNDIGVSKFAWAGDMADVNECDLLEHMLADEKTRVVLLYLEALKEPRRFMEIAKHARKPVIVLKAGVSRESRSRALTHTDSLSTDAEIYSSAFKQTGVIEAESVRELFSCGQLFERYEKRRIERIAIVSNTGGSSILAADVCYRLGLELAQLSGRTKSRILRQYPKIKTLNPVDMAADADGERYKFVLDAVAGDAHVDAIIIISQFKSCLLKPEDLDALKRVKTGKVVVACAPGDEDYRKARFFLRDSFPLYSSVDDAVKALKKAAEYGKRF